LKLIGSLAYPSLQKKPAPSFDIENDTCKQVASGVILGIELVIIPHIISAQYCGGYLRSSI